MIMKGRIGIVVVCAGLVSCVGTKELTIRTAPKGADITINGVPQEGTTPMTVTISQKRALGIVASKVGYESAAYTVNTRSNWWLSLLWTRDDPRAQFIPEDEVNITLRRIPTAETFRAKTLPPYGAPLNNTASSQPPALRAMPQNLTD